MTLYFATEGRFIKDKNGHIYGGASFNYLLWQRYLKVFSKIVVIARVQYDGNYAGKVSDRASGDNVSFIEIPYYVGVYQYILHYSKIQSLLSRSIRNGIQNGSFICRAPGTIANMVIKHLRRHKIPYGVEVVGDPWDVFAPGSIKHPLRPYLRKKEYNSLKKNVRHAVAAIYVTKHTLQQRYKSSQNAFTTYASNVKVTVSNTTVAKQLQSKLFYTIVSIGSLEQMYKGPDTVLQAIKILKDQHFNVQLRWLGDGLYRPEVQKMAKELGISEQVNLLGNKSAAEVKEELNAADLFVLASKTEGLPRAMIEAMAMGLPCIGTKVGGIPELLDPATLIEKNNPEALAAKIKMILTQESLYNAQAERNLKEAFEFNEDSLDKRRATFYNFLKKYNQRNEGFAPDQNK